MIWVYDHWSTGFVYQTNNDENRLYCNRDTRILFVLKYENGSLVCIYRYKYTRIIRYSTAYRRVDVSSAKRFLRKTLTRCLQFAWIQVQMVNAYYRCTYDTRMWSSMSCWICRCVNKFSSYYWIQLKNVKYHIVYNTTYSIIIIMCNTWITLNFQQLTAAVLYIIVITVYININTLFKNWN